MPAPEVEKIALNLEGCALSQGNLRAETQEGSARPQRRPSSPAPSPRGPRWPKEVRKPKAWTMVPVITQRQQPMVTP